MKTFNIDMETVEGIVLLGGHIEVQGAMTVLQESQPLEGVHQSNLRMSLASAVRLHQYLNGVLTEAQRQGMVHPSPTPRGG